MLLLYIVGDFFQDYLLGCCLRPHFICSIIQSVHSIINFGQILLFCFCFSHISLYYFMDVKYSQIILMVLISSYLKIKSFFADFFFFLLGSVVFVPLNPSLHCFLFSLIIWCTQSKHNLWQLIFSKDKYAKVFHLIYTS